MPICGPMPTEWPLNWKPGAGAAVARDLLVDITGQADMHALADELRHRPVEMQVDAVAILQRVVHPAVGEARDRGQLMPGLRIEVGVAEAAVDRGVARAQVGEARES